jgi:hypothetical protein
LSYPFYSLIISGCTTANSHQRTIVSPLPNIRCHCQDHFPGTPDDNKAIPETPNLDRHHQEEDDLFANDQNPEPDWDLEPNEELEPEVPNLANAIVLLAQMLQQP